MSGNPGRVVLVCSWSAADKVLATAAVETLVGNAPQAETPVWIKPVLVGVFRDHPAGLIGLLVHRLEQRARGSGWLRLCPRICRSAWRTGLSGGTHGPVPA